MKKEVIVVHSGGMDSSLCLADAIRKYGKKNVLSVSFNYQQRHSEELKRAAFICQQWDVDHVVLDINCLAKITHNSLICADIAITHDVGKEPNSLVVGRNGLMARIAAIHVNSLGGHIIYMGVIGIEASNSGYRDCSREYMDKMQEILRIDLNDHQFTILTPLVHMTKKETLDFGDDLGVLSFLLENTITCYEGMEKAGCKKCPACVLRNQGLSEYLLQHPDFVLSYRDDVLTTV